MVQVSGFLFFLGPRKLSAFKGPSPLLPTHVPFTSQIFETFSQRLVWRNTFTSLYQIVAHFEETLAWTKSFQGQNQSEPPVVILTSLKHF